MGIVRTIKTAHDSGRNFFTLTELSSFALTEVLLTDPYYQNAAQKSTEYLLCFDTDKLLAGFRDTAGLDTFGAIRYPGWETSLIGGHTLGHFLTACVQAYQSANSTNEQKEKLLSMITKIIFGLKECQETVGTGFLFGATILDRENIEIQFDNVEKQKTNIFTQAWVPWYTLHKIFEGLLSVSNLTDKSSTLVVTIACSVASKLGDWVYNRTSQWSFSTRNVVLGIEYGGMNDCLYDLYQLTKKEKHEEAAHLFDQTALFEKVLRGKAGDNILNNLHANTTIPKFLGALNRYLTYQKEENAEVNRYLLYAEAFWELVVNSHTYITGGNSEWEHFGLDGVLDEERTNCNCETCNAYNMLKLTKKLFMLTGNVKYADYYENTLLNSILPSQNPDTGMTMYFQPMATGYFKVFGEPFTKFWCCTGSGMENFTKLSESFYYYKEDTLVVNQYISSQLLWRQKGIKLIQETKLPKTEEVSFYLESMEGKEMDITLAFRLPYWLIAEAVICVNDTSCRYEVGGGYAIVKGPFADGSKIEITLPMGIKASSLLDSANVYGFQYGPMVLSALLGKNEMIESTTGVEVTVPLTKQIEKKYVNSENNTILVKTDTVEAFIENVNDHMLRDNSLDQVAFKLQHTNADLTFVPHYAQFTERYGIYWNFISRNEFNEHRYLSGINEKGLEAIRLDTVQPGYGQYENDILHNMKEYGSGSTGDTSVGTSRYANANGSFSYRLIVDIESGTNLIATVKNEDNGKKIKISVGDKVVYERILQAQSTSEEYDLTISLPKEILDASAETVVVNGQNVTAVTFTFEGAEGEDSARLCHFLYSVKVG